MKHGHGTLRWADRREFVGDFADGLFHGHGRMQWPDGRVFLGHYPTVDGGATLRGPFSAVPTKLF